MATQLLTDTAVKSARLPDGKAEATLTDLPGLVLRLRQGSNGAVSKSWRYRYTINGVKKALTLGSYPLMSLSDARAALQSQQALVAQGVDPLAQREAAEALKKSEEALAKLGGRPDTLDDLFQLFVDKYAKGNYSDGGATLQACYKNHIQASLGKVRLDLLTTAVFSDLLHSVKAKGEKAGYSKGHARTVGIVMDLLKRMYAWAFESGYIDNNPAAGLRAKNVGASKGEIGERVLSPDEIQLLTHKLRFADMNPRWKCMAWLMLSCLTRVEETSLARVEHVDLESNTWLIPRDNQKSTRKEKPADHVIALSPFAVEQMRYLLQDAANRKAQAAKEGKDSSKFGVYLFPSRKVAEAEEPCNEKTTTHQFSDRQRSPEDMARPTVQKRTQSSTELVLPGGKWTSHDLRRTGATLMRNLGIDRDTVEHCLNHVVGSRIERTYQKTEKFSATQRAWDTLGAKLTELVAAAHADTETTQQHMRQAAERKQAKKQTQAVKAKQTKATNKASAKLSGAS